MEKKNNKVLYILLVIPFVIGLITFVSVKALENTVKADISGIRWDYKDNEAFKVSENPYLLEAEPIVNEGVILADGNNLIWKAENYDTADTNTYARIENNGEDFYLYAMAEGKVKITCQNERGTKNKSFIADIFENGALIINPVIQGSNESVYKTRNYGEYNLKYTEVKKDSYTKVNSYIDISTQVYAYDGVDQSVSVKEKTDNIEYSDNRILIKGSGEASLTLQSTIDPTIQNTFSFNIVDEGVNVYSYNDLLMCTNFSTSGEVAVMQVNLESLDNTLIKETNKAGGNIYKDEYLHENTKLFGNFDLKTQEFNFANELVEVPTTYNSEFIDQYNKQNNANLTKNFRVGINVKKSFVGNGFTINMHELAYPVHGKVDVNKKIRVPDYEKDYFFGPLPYVIIGKEDEYHLPIVKAYGQDNAGMYINGDNITLDDIKLRNTNELNEMYDLLYTGSVIDVQGKNNTIKNSVVSNGRTIVRAYNADNLNIDNCILKNSGEFIVKAGSNRINRPDESKGVYISTRGDNSIKVEGNFDEVFNTPYTENTNSVDYIYNQALFKSTIDSRQAQSALKQVQEYLDNTTGIKNADGSVNYDQTITINDTLFNNSAMFSIGLETSFNGLYLYNGTPSDVKKIFTYIPEQMNVLPDNIGGTSYPVKINLTGKTKFYDWKDISKIDIQFLIEQNFSAILSSIIEDVELQIDQYFPVKPLLYDYIKSRRYIYTTTDDTGKQVEYINTPIAYYGGGLNLSTVDTSMLNSEVKDLSRDIETDFVEAVLEKKYANDEFNMLLSQCVISAIGVNPFKFVTNSTVTAGQTPLFFGEVPQFSDIYNNFNNR